MDVLNLPPAASLYLAQGEKTRHRELLRITFFDLVARGYLATRQDGNETRVGVGHALPDAALKPFERLFLKPFERDNTRQLPMASYIRLVGSYLPSTKYFMDQVFALPALQGLTSKSWWTGRRKLTVRGEELRSRIQSRIQQVEQELTPGNLGDLTRQYGGFLLLATGASLLFYNDFRQYRSGIHDGSDTWMYSSALYSDSSGEPKPEGDPIQDSWSEENQGHGDSGGEPMEGTDGDSGSDSSGDSGGDSGCSSGCGGGCGGGGD